LSAEDYANIIRALHFVFWPMVLVTLSRKYFRKGGAEIGE
jgi:hypothetical protein